MREISIELVVGKYSDTTLGTTKIHAPTINKPNAKTASPNRVQERKRSAQPSFLPLTIFAIILTRNIVGIAALIKRKVSFETLANRDDINWRGERELGM
jgi:hypothetical protein